MEPKDIFIIRPVRNVTEEVKAKIADHVAKLEAQGHKVYDPDRDNPYQKTDLIGIKIIKHNRYKMDIADEVRIWYDKGSTGSIFDIGMFSVFTMRGFKKFVIINREEVASTPDKSFQNVVLTLENEFDSPITDGLKEKWEFLGQRVKAEHGGDNR